MFKRFLVAAIVIFGTCFALASTTQFNLTVQVQGVLPIANGGTNAGTASAGTVPNATSGTAASWTATPTLGASGTLGSITFGNATSGTVTLAPVTGALGTVTASLPANTGTIDELNLAATFTAAKTFTNSDFLLLGSSTGATTLTSANSSSTAYTLTVPANTGTLAETNLAQSWTAAQNYASNWSGITSAASTTSTSFTSTGIAFPSSPASTTNYGRCVVSWEGSSTSYTVTFGLANSAAPTGLYVQAVNWVGTTTPSAVTMTTISSTTATAITPAMTPGAATTAYRLEIDVMLNNGSTADTVTLDYKSSSSSGTAYAEPGSHCGWY